uniref:Major facilitator superfamily (MFS) profile domain-containing protein n=1 Tax=Strigamia maritima TaxID=126957 RepID=T1J6T6_STRMM
MSHPAEKTSSTNNSRTFDQKENNNIILKDNLEKAKKKGVPASVYGFIFSSFSLTMFLFAPIGQIGPYFMMNSGLFVNACCIILFGLLDNIHSRTSFTAIAFLVRIVEAIGNAAYSTAIQAILTETFPTEIEKTFGFFRGAYGLGLIMGPAIGGTLYQLSGYALPFFCTGGFLLIVYTLSTILFWNKSDNVNTKISESIIVKALRIPSVSLSMVAVCLGGMSIGFLNVTLEPHLHQFNLQAIEVGLMFVLNGSVFSLTSVLWGLLCRRKISPKIEIALGASIMCIAYLLIGPAPFMPWNSSVIMCAISMAFHGFGLATELLASYSDALEQSKRNDCPDSYQTYGVISGLWTAFFQLGNFIGPSIGGVLYDQIGFREASVVLLGLQLGLMV